MSLDIAISPCPNDTFTFHAWIHEKVFPELPVVPTMGDIQELNLWAKEGRFPLLKISFSCLGQILDQYVMLPVGAALGRGCGPKIIARKPCALEDLADMNVAIPGKDTTAHLLTQLLAPQPAQKTFCIYDEVLDLLKEGKVDAGVIIHETRFTYQDHGMVEVADLGEIWEETYASLIPLGCVVARRDLGEEMLSELTDAIRASLSYAWDNPQASLSYVLESSQEKDPDVVQSHIHLYVTEESLKLSEEGEASIERLFVEARKLGIMPPCEQPWLFKPVEVPA